MKAKGKVLAWGNSCGVRLSKAALTEAGIGLNREVDLDITLRSSTAGDIFGKLPHKGNTTKILREIDRAYGEK